MSVVRVAPFLQRAVITDSGISRPTPARTGAEVTVSAMAESALSESISSFYRLFHIARKFAVLSGRKVCWMIAVSTMSTMSVLWNCIGSSAFDGIF